MLNVVYFTIKYWRNKQLKCTLPTCYMYLWILGRISNFNFSYTSSNLWQVTKMEVHQVSTCIMLPLYSYIQWEEWNIYGSNLERILAISMYEINLTMWDINQGPEYTLRKKANKYRNSNHCSEKMSQTDWKLMLKILI